jgi:hypothetical protein
LSFSVAVAACFNGFIGVAEVVVVVDVTATRVTVDVVVEEVVDGGIEVFSVATTGLES